jgi:hypothetical protein
LAVTFTFIGCLEALEDELDPGAVETVVFDLTEFLKDKAPTVIKTQAEWDAVFGEAFVQSGGEFHNNHVEFEIFSDGGVNKLRVNARASWGAGLDLKHVDMNFRGGDTIEIKGVVESGAAQGIVLNTNHAAFAPAGGVTLESPFNETITLSSADASQISAASPRTIRIRSR